MEDEGGEEPPAPGTEEDAPLKPLPRPVASSTQVSDSSSGKAGARPAPPPRSWGLRPPQLGADLGDFLQGAVEPTPAPLLSAKPQKRKAMEMAPSLMQRTATIGSCPVIYSQPLMAASKYQPSAVPLASLRPRQRLQGEIQGRPNLRLAPGHTGPQPATLGLQSSYLGVTAPAAAAPPVMSYSECAAPVSLAATTAPLPAPPRGALPTTSPAEQPPPPPPPQTPPPPTPKAPPPPEKEKPRKGRKDKVRLLRQGLTSALGALFALPCRPHRGLLVFMAQGKKGKTKMPSLVKKWQSIQRELDEEENSSSSEEDRETTAQRRIEEWKQQQLMR